MAKYTFVDTNTKEKSTSLEALFPDWDGPNERVMVYCGHDDDAILGCGYAMSAILDDGAEVYMTIACNGHCGYSTVEEKDTIVERRREEAYQCYERFGIPRQNILRLENPDFSANNFVGLYVDDSKKEGHFRKTITFLREHKITRILVVNHYHEHIDHSAANMMGSFDAPQAGDAHSVDWATPYPVKSVAEYSCWADLDPEDALVCGRDTELRANVVLAVDKCVEGKVIEGVKAFPSQAAIIDDLCKQREGRRLADGRMIECYLRFDPRPKFNFTPYKKFFE